ncbi:MAG: alpha/beta hydrolase [Phycisphaeraceae bacterium]|nr:alpha/beta hydrolase [Phycisphaeraceae bacterium]
MPLIPLWPDADLAPLATLELFPGPDDRAPTVLILPGGAYGGHADHEGPDVARWLNGLGFHAAVLRYRCGPEHLHPAPIGDAARAARLLRTGGTDLPAADALAVIGFSAGGHLAATLATQPDRWADPRDDLADTTSARIDTLILGYPVIAMTGPDAHIGSRNNLLGPDPDPEIVADLEAADFVDASTPPTFLWHTTDDGPVPVGNTLRFLSACRTANVPAEAHVYESGVHGLGLAEDQPANAWTDAAAAFLQRHLTCH